MELTDYARDTIRRSLDSCLRADIQGRARLAVIRAELLRAGIEHRDTPGMCRGLGFTMEGLTVLNADEVAGRA